MKPVIVCGDSFNIGIGCTDLRTQPYGNLVSQKLGLPLLNFAKGSSSNHSIYLQARHASHLDPALVIICVTSYDRIEWLPEGTEVAVAGLEAYDVNYHQYPPYGPDMHPDGTEPLPHPFVNDTRYTGLMKTEQFHGVLDYLTNWRGTKHNTKGSYYERLRTDVASRLKTLQRYFVDCYEREIKRDYDLGVMAFAIQILQNKNIPYLLICKDARLTEHLPERNVIAEDWFELARIYPDTIGSMHCSPEGHKYMSEVILKKINDERLLGE